MLTGAKSLAGLFQGQWQQLMRQAHQTQPPQLPSAALFCTLPCAAPARPRRAKPTLISRTRALTATCARSQPSSQTLALAIIVLCLLSVASAQQPMPFLGRGDSPPTSPVDVYVTAYLDRLLHVDDKEYAFSVGWAVL